MYGRNSNMYNAMTGNMGYANQTGPNPMQAQIQQLQQQLNALSGGQMMQQQPIQAQQQQFNQPFQPVPDSSNPKLSSEQVAILALFDEFSETEDGKQLVAFIGKFNGFCQSKVSKAKK